MTDAPKLWRDMNDAEKGALLLARHRGEIVQFHAINGNWLETIECAKWVDQFAYRVKPKAPNVEFVHEGRTVSLRVGGDRTHANITHTYTITDGRVTACDTIIHD